MLIASTLSLALSLAAAPVSGPTLASEDTMRTELPEILIHAPRVTLNEILDRVARGEARRESLLVDQAFTASFRIVRAGKKPGDSELIRETVSRVFKKRPDRVRSILVRQWQKKEDEDKSVEIRFRASMGEDIVNFAFQPSARRDFRYRILGRDLVGDHLIYRIAFEPRSPLDPSHPSGLVWVDTNDFVIVRQEINFRRSPAPLFLKGIDRMVIERRRVDGHWVLWRVLMRAAATLPLPLVGRTFDISLLFDQYAINQGIEDAFFDSRAERP